MHFQPNAFLSNLPIIGVYFVARIIGKTLGATLAAKSTGAPKTVTRYLGLTLIPQAGIAIGLALELSQTPAFASISFLLINVILATTMVYEVLGPIAAKYALKKSGEMGAQRQETP
jgi:Kef-type K+ transport system membrane component KefB